MPRIALAVVFLLLALYFAYAFALFAWLTAAQPAYLELYQQRASAYGVALIVSFVAFIATLAWRKLESVIQQVRKFLSV
jgi:hypothetical protein